MKYKFITCALGLLISGCEITNGNNVAAAKEENQCVFISMQAAEHTEDEIDDGYRSEVCDFAYWTQFWLDGFKLDWQTRKETLIGLGDSPEEKLKKVLLSQAANTPYQDRLRAVNWATDLLPTLSPKMSAFIEHNVIAVSQQMLELESAVTVLSRLNAAAEKQIEEQAERIAQQQAKIEKLMKIEASMVPRGDGSNQ
ncbi:hypothetical protein OE749_12725 [Aestuariibacter sp. AA17]|uniref:Quorum-sensing regulator protein G n=1 Tax=Fluctibacter corallii TaxID=2984329 RepID=A0ABT3AB84_9ALTE|nr:hypothetical protein [Aestuariibacter sp. AA17]MCV2885556.1 hypothetical protein [Aestuariibacter sp. AA17]